MVSRKNLAEEKWVCIVSSVERMTEVLKKAVSLETNIIYIYIFIYLYLL
jgi:hypothetical protein